MRNPESHKLFLKVLPSFTTQRNTGVLVTPVKHVHRNLRSEIATTNHHTSEVIARTIVREKCVEWTVWESSALSRHRGRLAVGIVRRKNVEDREGHTKGNSAIRVHTDVPAVVWTHCTILVLWPNSVLFVKRERLLLFSQPLVDWHKVWQDWKRLQWQ
jgi:hypothetical protein